MSFLWNLIKNLRNTMEDNLISYFCLLSLSYSSYIYRERGTPFSWFPAYQLTRRRAGNRGQAASRRKMSVNLSIPQNKLVNTTLSNILLGPLDLKPLIIKLPSSLPTQCNPRKLWVQEVSAIMSKILLFTLGRLRNESWSLWYLNKKKKLLVIFCCVQMS